jgi:lipoprotein-anchoring transpeptidase ErfK/SrfK
VRKLLVLLAGVSLVPASLAAAPRGFEVRDMLPIHRPLPPGDFVWDDDGVPPGRTQIVVDLAAEQIHVYRAGYEIARSSIIYGADDKPTPTGTFPILSKKEFHFSNKYRSPMPYSLWLTKSGVAIHGSEVDYNAATHGCIGVPERFAAMLFDETRVGDRVLVTRRWRPDFH